MLLCLLNRFIKTIYLVWTNLKLVAEVDRLLIVWVLGDFHKTLNEHDSGYSEGGAVKRISCRFG